VSKRASNLRTDITVRHLGTVRAVYRGLTNEEADRIMGSLTLEPGDVAGRREYFPA
jgi:hypothetical protein